MNEKNIVVITGTGDEHRYVANRISERFANTHVIAIPGRGKRSFQLYMLKSPKQFILKALWRLQLSITKDSQERTRSMQSVLGQDYCREFLYPERLTRMQKPDNDKLFSLVKGKTPDIIVVYGTGIIPDRILSLSNVISLNMHTGLSPYYRGAGCAFWPVYNKDFSMIGSTVHECTTKVDGGKIFKTASVTLGKSDGLHHVFARCVHVGCTIYLNVISDALKGNLSGKEQDMTIGREYRGHMRNVINETIARRRLKKYCRSL